MNPVFASILGISLIFLCTAIGAAFVFFFKEKEISPRINRIFLGFASGIMLAAAVFSLIIPALHDENTTYMPLWAVVAISIAIGALFIWGIDKLVPHLHIQGKEEGIKTNKLNKTSKVFLAVTIHNIPEGLSVGITYGVALANWNNNPQAALMGALMLAIGIGIQNVPEGAAVALMYKGETGSNFKAFLFGTMSGIVEPIAAIFGLFLAMQIQVIMPWSLAFAAGCMIYVIAEEMIPDIKSENSHFGIWSFIIGFILMMVLDISLG